MSKIAVVTGASSGIGKEFVKQLDTGIYSNLDEIWVIARRLDRLEELQSFCYTPVRIIQADLTTDEGLQSYTNLLDKEKPTVEFLINAAGMGVLRSVLDTVLDDVLLQHDLNVLAVLNMCYHTLPYMLNTTHAHIINLSSAAAFLPGAGLSVYSADKAWVLSFSRSLNAELRGTGINVTAVCPKGVSTEFFNHTQNNDKNQAIKSFGLERPYNVARAALVDTCAGKDLSISSLSTRCAYVGSRLLPYSVQVSIAKKLGFN